MAQAKTVREFAVGETVQLFLLVKKAECKKTQAGKPYMDFVLGDASGEIAAKLWDSTPEDEAAYRENMIVKVRAAVREWNGAPQLAIEKIRPTREEDGVAVGDFVPTAPLDPAAMLAEVEAYAARIAHPDIRGIVTRLLAEYRDKLLYYPAAQKNHHAVRSGWLYHIVTMLRASDKMGDVYPFLNRDLLFAGVILHDIAKLEEMDANELGIVSDYTVEGQLLGHLVQGALLVDRVGEELGADPEVRMVLKHMVLSHHYKGEWGSPKAPMIPEAELLHHLDIIDAHLYDMRAALEKTPPGNMSERVWTLGRKVYRTTF